MARDTFEEWIADENSSEVIHKLDVGSAVEALGRPEQMASAVKQIPRDGGFTVGNVAKGSAYAESQSTDDKIDLIARKVGGIERIAAEDLVDTFADPLKAKRYEAARALAINYDNSCLAVTADMNGTTIKYESAYRTLRKNGSGTQAAYVASANYTAVTKANFTAALAAGTGYNVLNDTVGLYEEGDFFDESDTIVIAHPAFRRYLRGVKDASGNPLLVPRDGGEIKVGGYNVFGYQTSWSKGAKTSDVDSQSPAGNPILLVCNRRFLVRGVASMPGIPANGVGFALQSPANGSGFDDDTFKMKAAFRRGFRLTIPFAAAVIEVTP
jgi:hypothetical protein